MYHLNALFGFPLGLWGAFVCLAFLFGAQKIEHQNPSVLLVTFIIGFIPAIIGFFLSKRWFDEFERRHPRLEPSITLAIPDTQTSRINSIPCPIPLGPNQHCILALRASRMISREVTLGYAQEHEGITLKMKNGPKYSYGSSARIPITENETQAIRGSLVLTNKNIVFASMEKGFSFPLGKITNIQTFENDCLMIQKDSTHYFLMFESPCTFEVISAIRKEISLSR